jgi:PilZ domain
MSKPLMKLINRRENPRIEIKLQCYVSGPASYRRCACTENISRNGLLIAWKDEGGGVPLPNLGEMVTVEIELPAHPSFGPKCIHFQGAVMRVSNESADGASIALRLDYLDFRSIQRQLFSPEAPTDRMA